MTGSRACRLRPLTRDGMGSRERRPDEPLAMFGTDPPRDTDENARPSVLVGVPWWIRVFGANRRAELSARSAKLISSTQIIDHQIVAHGIAVPARHVRVCGDRQRAVRRAEQVEAPLGGVARRGDRRYDA